MSLLRRMRRALAEEAEVNPLSRRTRFELGEGSDRTVAILAWPESGGAAFEVSAGTTVDVLLKRGHTEPPEYPARFASARVRITRGAHVGRVAWVRMYQVQAVSAAEV